MSTTPLDGAVECEQDAVGRKQVSGSFRLGGIGKASRDSGFQCRQENSPNRSGRKGHSAPGIA